MRFLKSDVALLEYLVEMIKRDEEVKRIRMRFVYPNKYYTKVLTKNLGFESNRTNRIFTIDYEEM